MPKYKKTTPIKQTIIHRCKFTISIPCRFEVDVEIKGEMSKRQARQLLTDKFILEYKDLVKIYSNTEVSIDESKFNGILNSRTKIIESICDVSSIEESLNNELANDDSKKERIEL